MQAKHEDRVFQILIIDDNPADSELLEIAWRDCKDVKATTSVLRDSRDAIKWLRGADPYPQPAVPDLIMLDYKMPVDGGIALTEIKGDPSYMQIPVIVLSGSENNRDYWDAYQRHANCCFRKPTDLKRYMGMVCDIANHWLLRAILPRP